MEGEADRPPGPATTDTGDSEPADARQFLLAAAARVERLPARTGAWWYEQQRTSEIHTFGVGGKTGPRPAYTVEVSQVTRSWSGRSRSRAVTTVKAPRFPSSRDRAAWRAAGSPSLMPGAPPDKTPPKPSVNNSDVPPSFLVGGESFTIDQLQRLPSDPGRLAARLRAAVQEQLEDPAGRRGTGVSFPESPEAERVFIVDKATATLLATELVANHPDRFGVRAPAGSTILSITWLETGCTDRLGQEP